MRPKPQRTTTETAQLKAFGDAVREAREALEVSQEAFAAECGLDRTYVGGVERGERNVALLNIFRIAQALGVEPGRLVTRASSNVK